MLRQQTLLFVFLCVVWNSDSAVGVYIAATPNPDSMEHTRLQTEMQYEPAAAQDIVVRHTQIVVEPSGKTSFVQSQHDALPSRVMRETDSSVGVPFERHSAITQTAHVLNASATEQYDTRPLPGMVKWATHPWKCLDLGGGKWHGTVNTWDCVNNANQKWQMPSGQRGEITIQYQCLAISAGQMHNGNLVIVWDCNGGPEQQWVLPEGGTGPIRSGAQPWKCLDMGGGKMHNGATVNIWDCKDGHPNQQWTIPQVPPDPAPPQVVPVPVPVPALVPAQPAQPAQSEMPASESGARSETPESSSVWHAK